MFDNWDDEDFGFYDTDSDEEAGTKVCVHETIDAFLQKNNFIAK